jgi:predicted acylesterase/phospholipase RssA
VAREEYRMFRDSRWLRAAAAMAALGIALGLGPTGCVTTGGPADQPPPGWVKERQAREAAEAASAGALADRMLAAVKAEQDDYAAGLNADPPVIDVLIISGGGDWGAFGAGVLAGWGRVTDPEWRRPAFDIVTGVSTGALIAPFAFLGDDASVGRVVELYRNPKKDWAQSRGLFFFMPWNRSFADVPGLERDLRECVDLPTLARIADAGRAGRMLFVNTTDVDLGDQRPWDLVAEADRGVRDGDAGRVRRILLASSAIPGVFPPRKIDGHLLVDGAVTGNILYGQSRRADDSFQARWTAAYPGVPIPRTRYWVIFNNQYRFPPQMTEQKWPAIIARSQVMATQASTVNAIRHLAAIAELARLKYGADVQVRVVAVPEEWVPPDAGAFSKVTMNDLADIGERMGADPSSWRAEVP